MNSDDVVEWVTEQIHRDQITARRAQAGPWTTKADRGYSLLILGTSAPALVAEAVLRGEITGRTVRHIVNWDPDRVLAHCAMTLKLIEGHRQDRPRVPHCDLCSQIEGVAEEDTAWPCRVIRTVASVYHRRDGFRPEWRA